MIKKLSKENMGTSNLGWLQSRFHFSFAEYRNPKNINFGVLRVLNDDIIHPSSGFDTHPHSNMEIISYIVDGEITHKDSMGNSETLKRGEVQYLSAGDGIYHSEHNLHQSNDLRLLQIWIIPPKAGLPRLYGSHRYKFEQRDNKLLNIVSSQDGNSNIKIYQDIKIFSLFKAIISFILSFFIHSGESFSNEKTNHKSVLFLNDAKFLNTARIINVIAHISPENDEFIEILSVYREIFE